MPAILTGSLVGGTALYKGISAAVRRSKAKKGLQALAKTPEAQYRSALDIQREAEASVRSGYTPEEKAMIMGQKAREENRSYQRAVQMNPNLAGAVTAGISDLGQAGYARIAADDARLKMMKQRELAGAITQQSNLKTQNEITKRRMREQEYGMAYQQASADIENAVGGAASGFLSMYGAFQGDEGGKSIGDMFKKV
jgi:hypothetical protein